MFSMKTLELISLLVHPRTLSTLCHGVCVLKCANVFNLLCELFVWLAENFPCDSVGKKDRTGALYFTVYIFHTLIYLFICCFLTLKKKGWVRLMYVFFLVNIGFKYTFTKFYEFIKTVFRLRTDINLFNLLEYFVYYLWTVTESPRFSWNAENKCMICIHSFKFEMKVYKYNKRGKEK